MDIEERPKTPKYHVKSVEKTQPPAGMPKGDWFHYVICEGDSVIEGYQPGSLNSVTRHAETFAEDLNARAANGYSFYSARKNR